MNFFKKLFDSRQPDDSTPPGPSPAGETPAHAAAIEQGEGLADLLRRRMADGADLPEIVTFFDEMCQIPLENTGDEEDLLLFETGDFSFSPEKAFHFTLTRQFPGGDGEYIQVQADVIYPASAAGKDLQDVQWSDWLEQGRDGFFDYVRASSAYQALKNVPYTRVEISSSET